MGKVAIIGAGPAGLIAAEHLAGAGHDVTIHDRMPSPGRKFLLAGRGGLNLTHSETMPGFIARYGEAAIGLGPHIEAFPPSALRAWCDTLGQPTFVGSSGRVFPTSFKAAPLLRAWLTRLADRGVRFMPHHRFIGLLQGSGILLGTPTGTIALQPDATLLALGGASWPRMGSDGAWVPIMRDAGIAVRDLCGSNAGVVIPWSTVFIDRFEGQPLKRIAVSAGGSSMRGEAVITRAGLEGGVIYAVCAKLRERLGQTGQPAILTVDLRPDIALETLAARLAAARLGRSLSNVLRQQAALSPAAIGLLQEALHGGASAGNLASLVKAIPLTVAGIQPIARAISSAGGITFSEVDSRLMLRRRPGIFVAGEMLDWDAQTGGYLLQACFSTGVAAASGINGWLEAG